MFQKKKQSENLLKYRIKQFKFSQLPTNLSVIDQSCNFSVPATATDQSVNSSSPRDSEHFEAQHSQISDGNAHFAACPMQSTCIRSLRRFISSANIWRSFSPRCFQPTWPTVDRRSPLGYTGGPHIGLCCSSYGAPNLYSNPVAYPESEGGRKPRPSNLWH